MSVRNPGFINVEKFINYCNEKDIAISRMDYNKHKVINLSSRELIEEYDCFLTKNDCLDNLCSRIQSCITSHIPYDTSNGDMYSDIKFVSPQHLADELIKLLDDENFYRVLKLYYESRDCEDELKK